MNNPAEPNGIERAAIFLLSLGEKEAAEVLKHLSAKDVQRVGSAMAELKSVSRGSVSSVFSQFSAAVESHTSLGLGTEDSVRRILVSALGADKAASLIDRISVGEQRKGLDALKWLDAAAVVELVRNEHPQVISIVLAYLEPDQAAAVLSQLPPAMRSELLTRVATLDGVRASALSELDEMMEKQFAGKRGGNNAALGGIKAAANILNLIESSSGSEIIAEIGKVDESLSSKIQDLMFIFDDLIEIDDRGMQELLRQVPSDKLLVALKGAEEELKAKIFRNMSERAAEMLKDDLEARGPIKLSEVEAAQKEVILAARKLADAGTISLGSKGDEYV